MTLNKDIINQTNRSHLNQPLNQMNLVPSTSMSSPRYPSLKSSSSTSWQNLNKIPESYPHRPYNSWRSAQCAGWTFLISLNYLSLQLSYLDLRQQRLRDFDLILSQWMKEQSLPVRFLSYLLLLLRSIFF